MTRCVSPGCGQPVAVDLITDGGVVMLMTHCQNGHDQFERVGIVPLPTPRKFSHTPKPRAEPGGACDFCRRSRKAGNGDCARHGGMSERDRDRARLKAYRLRLKTRRASITRPFAAAEAR